MKEWYYEVRTAPVPEPDEAQLQSMMNIMRGVIAYDKGNQELRFVFRLTSDYGVLHHLTEGQTMVGTALQQVIPEVGRTVPLGNYVRDFRMMRAEDVPVSPAVRRYAERMAAEGGRTS